MTTGDSTAIFQSISIDALTAVLHAAGYRVSACGQGDLGHVDGSAAQAA